jgi:hypothetical protein
MQKGKQNKVPEKITKKIPKKEKPPIIPDKIRFDYIKSNQHREILVEGIHGGLTPRAKIQMSLFCERQPIPRQIAHEFDGLKLGPEILSERLSRNAIIRSVDATLILDIETAEIMHNWLGLKIKEGKKIIKDLKPKGKK